LNHLKLKGQHKFQLLESQTFLLYSIFLPMFCLYFREKGP
jgi:hypothetical protein